LREPRPVRCNIERLAASAIPVLAIIGRDETLHDGARMAEGFRQRLPRANVELVDDANHLVFIDQPDVVAEQFEKFLDAR
jgi:pimeloyl-ACP methyl ester carboxylesterase